MRKIICDKCGKESQLSIQRWDVQIEYPDDSHEPYHYDLCENCQGRLKRWLTEKDVKAAIA